MKRIAPRLEVLPPQQRALWHSLRAASDLGFVLYGGTAVALRFGHRASVDFDFFCERPLDKRDLHTRLAWLARARVLQEEPNALTVLASAAPEVQPVKVSFFGEVTTGRVGIPAVTEDGVLELASAEDLFATKVKVVLQRVEAKDYRDIYALLGGGGSLARALGGARALYGSAFPPAESLKALAFFEGGDLSTLCAPERAALVRAVRGVRKVPSVPLRSTSLSALRQR